MDAELDSLRELARDFLQREAAPNQQRWLAEHAVDREFWN
ncbi:hypothetical protein CHEID_09685 [Corynebacterium heidelbergense]|nr:hypothetical protein CHEID_09685 [Corynebacterium heidelbergense]